MSGILGASALTDPPWTNSEVGVSPTNRPTFAKRQKEQKRKERRQKKAERRALRQDEKRKRIEDAPSDPDVDPDIAEITPGPQPPRY